MPADSKRNNRDDVPKLSVLLEQLEQPPMGATSFDLMSIPNYAHVAEISVADTRRCNFPYDFCHRGTRPGKKWSNINSLGPVRIVHWTAVSK